MSPKSPKPHELGRLFQDLEDGSISAPDHAWLMDLLREQPEVRREFRSYMAVSSGLHHLADAWAGLHEDGPPELPKVVRPRWWMRPLPRAAAALIFGMAVATAFFLMQGRHEVATLAGADTAWHYEAGGLDGAGGFLPATRFAVERGVLEIHTRDGSSVLLEGPARFELRDARQASLDSGSAWFSIAASRRPLEILSPRLHTVATGADFGIQVTPQEDRLHVAAGQVITGSRLAGQPSREVGAGQALALGDVGGLVPVPCRPGIFRRGLSADAVLHWTFDDEGRGLGSGSDPEYRVSSFRRASPLELVPGRFGRAIHVGSSGAISDFDGIHGASPRTIAVWVKGRHVDWSPAPRGRLMTPSLVAWGAHDDFLGTKWQVAIYPDGGSLVTQWGGSWVTATASVDLLDDRWHHVASVFTGRYDHEGVPDIRHYIDGARVSNDGSIRPASPVNTRIDLPESRPMLLGLNEWRDMEPAAYPWSIDELFIVRRALTDEQVARLYRENKID